MNCSEARKLVTLYAGGELEADESAAVREHLASCVRCRALAEAFLGDRLLVASLREWGPGPPEAGEFWAALRERVEPEMRRRRVRALLHRTLHAASIAAVFVLTVTFLLDFGSDTGVTPPAPAPTAHVAGTVREEVSIEGDFRALELEECDLAGDASPRFDF